MRHWVILLIFISCFLKLYNVCKYPVMDGVLSDWNTSQRITNWSCHTTLTWLWSWGELLSALKNKTNILMWWTTSLVGKFHFMQIILRSHDFFESLCFFHFSCIFSIERRQVKTVTLFFRSFLQKWVGFQNLIFRDSNESQKKRIIRLFLKKCSTRVNTL